MKDISSCSITKPRRRIETVDENLHGLSRPTVEREIGNSPLTLKYEVVEEEAEPNGTNWIKNAYLCLYKDLRKKLRSLKRIRDIKGYFSGPDGAQKYAPILFCFGGTCVTHMPVRWVGVWGTG
jgi:hypothetical protein